MKTHLLICLLAFGSFSSFGQDKAMLTKGETINYLNKLFQKVKGYKCLWKGCEAVPLGSITDISFKEEAEVGVGFSYSSDERSYESGCGQPGKCCWPAYTLTQQFNPAYITSIDINTSNGGPPISYCVITFTNTGLVKYIYTSRGKTSISSVHKVNLFFFKGENADFEKLKKALFHLRDLCKAEEDPFGE